MNFNNEVGMDLISLVEQDFGRQPSPGLSHETMLKWLHYRARLIPQRPRKVVVSEEVQSLRATYPAISEIEARLRMAGDLRPWLSNRIRTNKKKIVADMMFNDWQVSHFHLGRFYQSVGVIKRTDKLLYAFIDAEKAVLLDVEPHGAYTATTLLQILLRNSPKDLPEIHGVEAEATPLTDDQLAILRTKRTNASITIDGRVYMSPGLGIVTSGSAMRISRFDDMLIEMIHETMERLKANSFPPNVMRRLVAQLGLPVRLGLHLQQGVFVTYEKNRSIPLMQMRPLA